MLVLIKEVIGDLENSRVKWRVGEDSVGHNGFTSIVSVYKSHFIKNNANQIDRSPPFSAEDFLKMLNVQLVGPPEETSIPSGLSLDGGKICADWPVTWAFGMQQTYRLCSTSFTIDGKRGGRTYSTPSLVRFGFGTGWKQKLVVAPFKDFMDHDSAL